MGSESPPSALFDAIPLAVQQFPALQLIIFATLPIMQQLHEWSSAFPSQIWESVQFCPVLEAIEMEDDPLVAFRNKKNSSMAAGLTMLKKRQLDGFITAGNTGALIAGAVVSLPKLPGIKRPALLTNLPTEQGDLAVIDVGGSVACKAEHLLQFAAMGAAYQRCCRGIALPRVGLLNIGVESKKGTAELQKAYQLLQRHASRFHFVGNIEGREGFQGHVDVLVTDGFTGNVLLKTAEGVSLFLLSQLKQAIQELPGQQQEAVFRRLKDQFDYEEYSGAIICGVDGVVVKCHGKSTARAFLNGIKGAVKLVGSGFISQLKGQL
ncbi:MAG: phosphate acyltransferase PlsX [Parachlamydia sp.]|jgi:glycerol-3-phosphate acyltransferase PlsX|nr:phosphate acyltransferase PlsX [Parachlamydia sp.]